MSNVLLPPVAGSSTGSSRPPDERREVLRDGTDVRIRPIQRGDVELERRFIEELSARSRRFRFLDSMSSPSVALLRELTEIDATTEAAYVAIVVEDGRECEIGVARLSAPANSTDCEFAIAVSDAWQRRGLGTLLMQRLIEVATARGLKTMHSVDSAENDPMRAFAKHLHLAGERNPEDVTQMLYSVDLPVSAAAVDTGLADAARR